MHTPEMTQAGLVRAWPHKDTPQLTWGKAESPNDTQILALSLTSCMTLDNR